MNEPISLLDARDRLDCVTDILCFLSSITAHPGVVLGESAEQGNIAILDHTINLIDEVKKCLADLNSNDAKPQPD